MNNSNTSLPQADTSPIGECAQSVKPFQRTQEEINTLMEKVERIEKALTTLVRLSEHLSYVGKQGVLDILYPSKSVTENPGEPINYELTDEYK